MTAGAGKVLLNNYMHTLSQDYNLEARVLDASYYGCPTKHTRLFILGIKKSLDIHPKPERRMTISSYDLTTPSAQEIASLQTLPKIQWPDDLSHNQKLDHLGHVVPPKTLKKLATGIIWALDKI